MNEDLNSGTLTQDEQRVLLKCEEKYGQQKYMQSIITKK